MSFVLKPVWETSVSLHPDRRQMAQVCRSVFAAMLKLHLKEHSWYNDGAQDVFILFYHNLK